MKSMKNFLLKNERELVEVTNKLVALLPESLLPADTRRFFVNLIPILCAM